MHTSRSLVLACLLAAGCMGAHAAPPSVTRSASFDMSEQQMRDIAGAYRLSDGRTMWIRMVDGKLYVDLGRNKRQTLSPRDQYTFTSTDRSISLVFDRGGSGQGDVRLAQYRDDPLLRFSSL